MIQIVSNQLDLFNDFSKATVSDIIKYFSNKDEIALDSETTGFDPHSEKVLTLQLGDEECQFVIDWQTLTVDEIDGIKTLLESNKTIIMHNAQFDLGFLYALNIHVNHVYDTLLAEALLTAGYGDQEDIKEMGSVAERKLGLKDVAQKYTGAILDKEIRGVILKLGLTKEVITYAAEDVKYLRQIKSQQTSQIEKLELDRVLTLENDVVKVFARMAFDGIRLDVNKWLEVVKITEENVKRLTGELDEIVVNEPKLHKFVPKAFQQNLFGFAERKLEINWSSSVQKLAILKELGLDIESSGTPALLKHRHAHNLLPTLIDYAKQSKLATAFGKDFLKYVNKHTGRIHMSIWQILSTGRISVRNPNLNQIPSKGDLAKVIRSSFIPTDGYKIVGGDYSSFELAIIAEFSEDPLWIKTLKAGKNLHTELCAATFDICTEDVKKPFPPKPDITYRDVQKTVDFGLAYGMSHFKLSGTIEVSEEEAKDIIEKFFSVVPKVKAFLDKLGYLGKSRGYIRTAPPFRRIRWFPAFEVLKKEPTHSKAAKWLNSMERKAKNMPIQGTNGDVIKLALVKVQEEIDRNKWPVRILLSVYDEIQTECRADKAEEWKIKLQELMIEAARVILKTVPIEAEVQISDHWKK